MSPILAQRVEKSLQAVVIQFLHQRQQSADLPRRKTLAREPVEVMARQVGNQAALLFAKGHLRGDEALEVFGVHGRYCAADAGTNVGTCASKCPTKTESFGSGRRSCQYTT